MDLPEGDEMDTQPGVWSLTRTRYKGAACLKMYVRPHKVMMRSRPRGARGLPYSLGTLTRALRWMQVH